MSSTLTYVGTLVDIGECCSCGIRWAVPKPFYDKRREDGQDFYCPNGHGQHFTETEAQRLRKQLEQAERRARANRDLLEAEERSHSATRGHLTRQKKRVGNGVCPCCNRTFKQLAAHMASKHPEYALSPSGASGS